MTSQGFEEALQSALSHLYDPDYQPSAILCAVIGCDIESSVPMVRSAIVQGIQDLAPATNTPVTSHTKQLHDLLHQRFVLKLTQEQTADRLNVSRRTVNRLQRRATHLLAGVLWEQGHSGKTETKVAHLSPDTGTADQTPNWQAQMEQELAALNRETPDTVSDVGDLIDGVLEFLDCLPPELCADVEVMSVQSGLVTAVHPVVMHQVLLSVIQRLARRTDGGHISIYARLEDGDAVITVTGPVPPDTGLDGTTFTEDIRTPADVSLRTCIDHGQAFVWVQTPSVGKISVLVADDNEDMARLYRDATIGTRYHITSTTRGQELLDLVEVSPPDVIILDVMLPDIDGWRVLMRLHEDNRTRPIPVIVCSVVREEQLALSLGAAKYLIKPVRPREFIEALDQVSPQAPSPHAPAGLLPTAERTESPS